MFLQKVYTWSFRSRHNGRSLNIVENESLRKVLSNGPKYREPPSINWNYNFKVLMDAVEVTQENGLNENKKTSFRVGKGCEVFNFETYESFK